MKLNLYRNLEGFKRCYNGIDLQKNHLIVHVKFNVAPSGATYVHVQALEP